MGKKHKPPSRIKYEQNHPVVSFRIEKGLYDKLNSYLEKEKISKPDFIKIALKEQEANYDIAYNNGYKIGYEEGKKEGEKQGYEKGMNSWAIWVYCWRCRETIYIKPNSEEHKKIIELTHSHINHKNCYPKYK